MTRARAGALTVLPSTMFLVERRRLVDLAAKNRLPAVYTTRELVDAGGLMSYGQPAKAPSGRHELLDFGRREMLPGAAVECS